ncbi:glycosyltransferase family 39 protein [Actinomadura rupiterrae]|uniref:glycosyltransferase family 39 protein n=1 Tax=Actinomadura rupiterrae TaxID=559627 RepID=UPI0020A5240A|nr:glycosyltransferase family 39 protein [Actinomadura rupiterrae]MCP2343258.1 4-amino-4-deoxy-L-arabinose transferase-like glycosyltransferase [Actinomadura rupiterrae]
MSATVTAGASEGASRAAASRRGRVGRLLLGPQDDPVWVRPGLWAVLALAAVLYAWGLSKSGDANSYYAAAVKSGTQSWKAFFFGSLDAGSFITVDKPPMALWVMGLFARVIGFGSWSLLLPQVVEGVAAVALLHVTVRRAFGPAAGLLAAGVLTLTPITVAINRDDNPDTLLTLLLVAAAWATMRALEDGRLRWLVAAAFFVGCGFNTKMLQAFIALPALAVAYLLFGPPALGRRVLHLLAAGAALVVSAGMWMVVVDLIPASKRPYIGGSTDGTVWDLVIGYNGLGRVFGQDRGGRGGAGAEAFREFAQRAGDAAQNRPRGGFGGGFGGRSGIGRMFAAELGGQISWLLPFAAIALVAGLVLVWRRPRTDLVRAALVLWGVWLAVHFVVFSFSEGTFHPYYTTAMAPAVAALVGGGTVLLVGAYRRSAAWSWVLVAAVAATGAWAFVLLDRTPHWYPALRWLVAAVTVLAVANLAAGRLMRRAGVPFMLAGLALALVAGLAGPGAFAASAASKPVEGTNPLAGPDSGRGFGPGGKAGRGFLRGFGGMPMPPGSNGWPGQNGSSGQGGQPGQPGQGGFPGFGQPPGGAASGERPSLGGRRGFGGPGGEVSEQMVAYLRKHQDGAQWLVAVGNAQAAASVILRTGRPVIAMGGFTGTDNAMTVGKLQSYVRSGKLRYIVLSEGGMGPGGRGTSEAVAAWVRQHGTLVQPAEYGGTSTSSAPGAGGPMGGGSAQLYRLG